MPKPGKYIVIEGTDGTGKTTQADLAQEYLESLGIEILHIKEPGGSPVAEAIRSVILDATLDRTPMTNLLLFTANRHELWHEVIQPALNQGVWVISTRNYWSSIAYQGYGEGVDTSVIEAITKVFTDKTYMMPDVGLILSLNDYKQRQERLSSRGQTQKPDTFETKGLEFQAKLVDAYSLIADRFKLPVIDADRSIEDVQIDIRRVIDKHLGGA